MASIEAQTWGRYIFVRQDIDLSTFKGRVVLTHEMKHVEQFYRYNFFGLGMSVLYGFQFVAYTIACMGLIPIAIRIMPLEKEAYDTEKGVK